MHVRMAFAFHFQPEAESAKFGMMLVTCLFVADLAISFNWLNKRCLFCICGPKWHYPDLMTNVCHEVMKVPKVPMSGTFRELSSERRSSELRSDKGFTAPGVLPNLPAKTSICRSPHERRLCRAQ